MPCPWYKGGVCTSPKLRRPSPAVTHPSRCLGSELEYKSCQFYVEEQNSGRTESKLVTSLKPAIAQQLRPYNPIHVIENKPSEKCPFIKVYSYSGGYLAECKVLSRLLTRSEVVLCSSNWSACPFYKIGSKRPKAYV